VSVPGRGAPDGAARTATPFERVAIVGLGVMGGSLARALRALPSPPRVVGVTPDPRDRDAAVASGAVDEAPSNAEVAAGSGDLVIYATPLKVMLELQAQHAGVWRPDAVVSDLSSLKLQLASQARALGVHTRYVSAHPMVGREGSGFGVSSAGLFHEATVWLSATDVAAEITGRVERFWSALGARPAWIDASAHDARMAHASHLPQLLANVLARHLEEHGLGRKDLGTGGRDMTRLAGSSPTIWKDLLEQSAPLLAPALREVGADLEALAALLDARDLEGVARLMSRTRAWSDPESAAAAADRASRPDSSLAREGR
jgi:prephenate dehydrogenase